MIATAHQHGQPRRHRHQQQHGHQHSRPQQPQQQQRQQQPQPPQPQNSNQRRLRIAFDLDETLGVPIIDGRAVTGFQMREGCRELLQDLSQRYDLILWSVSARPLLDKVLRHGGLQRYFKKTYSWNEQPAPWKDIRKVACDYLVDDSDHHREQAKKFGMESKYIVVSPYGSYEDEINPAEWVRTIKAALAAEEAKAG